jgi:uncharacterized membrane protein YdbT with pleckstrin-like domain
MLSLIHLPNHGQNERTVLFLRRHWLVLVKKIFAYAILGFLPIFFYFFIRENFSTDYFSGPNIYPLVILAASSYYLLVWLLFFYSFVDYYLDVWIVTNQRIINIEQQGLFSRVVSEQRLNRIQDITSEVRGFWATILHFGDVYIQTASETPRFIFKQVPDPYNIRITLNNLIEQDKREHPS